MGMNIVMEEKVGPVLPKPLETPEDSKKLLENYKLDLEK